MDAIATWTHKEKAIDREKFERLLRDTSRQAYSFAYRLTGNAAEAEDLVQDTFIRAYRFFDKYDQSLAFSAWLYRIMANAHIDHLRKKKRIKTTSLDQPNAEGSSTWDFAGTDLESETEILATTLEEPIQDALNEMNSEFRTAVLLADVEGLAYEEIAEVMNTSVGTVRSRIHRGRKQLRRLLSKSKSKPFKGYISQFLPGGDRR